MISIGYITLKGVPTSPMRITSLGQRDIAIVISDSENEAVAGSEEVQAVGVANPKLGMPMPLDAGNADDADQVSAKMASRIGAEGGHSTAFSLRRYVDMLWGSVPMIWGATSLAAQGTQEGNHVPAKETLETQLTIETVPKIHSPANQIKEPIEEPIQTEPSRSPAGERSTAPPNAPHLHTKYRAQCSPTLVNDKSTAPFPKPVPWLF